MKLKRWYCGGPVGGSLDYHRKDGIMNRNFVLQQAIEDNPTQLLLLWSCFNDCRWCTECGILSARHSFY